MMNEREWERLKASADARIDGVSVPPALITVHLEEPDTSLPKKRMELILPVSILRHELIEAQALGPDDDLRVFVRNDCRDHNRTAWAGYLTVLQQMMASTPTHSSGWFDFLFCKKNKPAASKPKWAIIGVDDVLENDLMIVIVCRCCGMDAKVTV